MNTTTRNDMRNALRQKLMLIEKIDAAWNSPIADDERKDLRTYILGPRGVQDVLDFIEQIGFYFQAQPLTSESSDDEIRVYLQSFHARLTVLDSYVWIA